MNTGAITNIKSKQKHQSEDQLNTDAHDAGEEDYFAEQPDLSRGVITVHLFTQGDE